MASFSAGSSCSPGQFLQEEEDREWENFRKTLDRYPSSFQLEDQNQLGNRTCTKVLKTLLTDIQAGLNTPLETSRSLNLSAYLYFLLNNTTEALKQTELALKQAGENRNVISLANKAAIQWRIGSRSKARETLKILHNLKGDREFQYLLVKARAELAFSYSCIGGRFAPKAIPLFKEVIAKARETEIWIWKFGLALVERRIAHMHCASVAENDSKDAKLQDIQQTLQEVINSCESSNLKAKCYSEIAHALHQKRKGKPRQSTDEAELTPEKACELALQLDSNDCSVLWKCGKLFRYVKCHEKSLELLLKAVELRPTSAGFHHLGLTYKAMAIDKKISKGEWKARSRGRGRYYEGRGRDSRGRGDWNSEGRGRGWNSDATGRGWNSGGRGRGWNSDATGRGWNSGGRGRGWNSGGRGRGWNSERTGRGRDWNSGGRGWNNIGRGRGENRGRGRGSYSEGRGMRRTGQGLRFHQETADVQQNLSATEYGGGRERRGAVDNRGRWAGYVQQGGRTMDENGRLIHEIQATENVRRRLFPGEDFASQRETTTDSDKQDQYQTPFFCVPRIDEGNYSQLCRRNRNQKPSSLQDYRHTEHSPLLRQRGDDKMEEVVEKGDLTTMGAYGGGDSDSADTAATVMKTFREVSYEEAPEDTGNSDTLLAEFTNLSLSETFQNEAQYPSTTPHPVEVATSPPPLYRTEPGHASDATQSVALQRDTQTLRVIVKSPHKEERFFHTDEFVREAVDAFRKSVELSEEENTRALYDLALMHKALSEFDEALKWLDIILNTRFKCVGPYDKINAYEQAGLILKEKSEAESDEKKKKELKEEGEVKLNMALRMCSRLCHQLPKLQHFIQNVWHAFDTLLEATEKSDRNATGKLFEKARLFSLIRNHRQSMAFLQEIDTIAPEEAKSRDYLKMRIENYVEMELYEDALTFIETLKLTSQYSTIDLFDDDRYVPKVYIKAARKVLLDQLSKDSMQKARSYFSSAFNDTVTDDFEVETTSSLDAESTETEDENDSFDVIFLHEDATETKAEALADVLKSACGLNVTNMGEDCLAGTPRNDSIFDQMNKSKLIVCLGGAEKVSPQLRLLLDKAAERLPTKLLLVEGDHVPEVMAMSQRKQYSEQLLLIERESHSGEDCGGGVYSANTVDAICDVFCFLTDIPFP